MQSFSQLKPYIGDIVYEKNEQSNFMVAGKQNVVRFRELEGE